MYEMLFLTVEGTWLEAGRSRRSASVPARPGPLPNVADEDADRRGVGGHPRQLGWCWTPAEPAPGHPRRDWQLHRGLHKDDGLRRECHCGRQTKNCTLILKFWNTYSSSYSLLRKFNYYKKRRLRLIIEFVSELNTFRLLETCFFVLLN